MPWPAKELTILAATQRKRGSMRRLWLRPWRRPKPTSTAGTAGGRSRCFAWRSAIHAMLSALERTVERPPTSALAGLS